jgi:hypothetical protein
MNPNQRVFDDLHLLEDIKKHNKNIGLIGNPPRE